MKTERKVFIRKKKVAYLAQRERDLIKWRERERNMTKLRTAISVKKNIKYLEGSDTLACFVFFVCCFIS